jgi:hypothetical protein
MTDPSATSESMPASTATRRHNSKSSGR